MRNITRVYSLSIERRIKTIYSYGLNKKLILWEFLTNDKTEAWRVQQSKCHDYDEDLSSSR